MATKKEMIDTIAKNIGSTQTNVRAVLEGYKDFVYSEIRKGHEVHLMEGMILGFRNVSGREYPNLQGEGKVFVPEHYAYKIRFGKEAKSAIDELNGK